MKRFILRLFTLIFLLLLISICIFFPIKHNNSKDLIVNIIDVDQGDSTLIESSSGKDILIDSGQEEFSHNVIRYLKKRHIKKIDYLVCSHYDADHIGGIDKIIDEFDVGTILVPAEKSSKKEFVDIVNSADNKGLNIVPIKRGYYISISKDERIDVLSPSHISDDTNKNSLVMLYRYKNQNLLFTGDADSEIESEILSYTNVPTLDFLKVSHHGSKTATSDIFIRSTKPKVSTISVGYKNKYSHPHDECITTLKKYGSRIYRTDINGSMKFYFDGKSIYASDRYKYE